MLQLAHSLVPGILGSADPMDHVLPHALSNQPLLENNIPFPGLGGMESMWFTNHHLMTLVAAGLMLLVFVPIGRRYQAKLAGGAGADYVPSGFTNMIEGMMEFLRTSVCKPVLHENTDRFMPFLWTFFFFILFCNLLGMVPIDPVAGMVGLSHIGGTATGNINVTAGLAIAAFLMFHLFGVKECYTNLVTGHYGHHHDLDEAHEGTGHDMAAPDTADHHAHHAEPLSPGLALIMAPMYYVWNFAPHPFAAEHARKKPSAGLRLGLLVLYAALMAGEFYGLGMLVAAAYAPQVAIFGAVLGVIYALCTDGFEVLDLGDALMWGFLIPLEIIGALVKPFALCMRLFANMVAGHLVLASLLLLIPAYQGLTAGYLAGALPVGIGCTLLSCLELFVAFLQAFIFTYLSCMFLGASVSPDH